MNAHCSVQRGAPESPSPTRPSSPCPEHRRLVGRAEGMGQENGVSVSLPTGSDIRRPPHTAVRRSEEHTSELQSLIRTSYAVFCLQKLITLLSLSTSSSS